MISSCKVGEWDNLGTRGEKDRDWRRDKDVVVLGLTRWIMGMKAEVSAGTESAERSKVPRQSGHIASEGMGTSRWKGIAEGDLDAPVF